MNSVNKELQKSLSNLVSRLLGSTDLIGYFIWREQENQSLNHSVTDSVADVLKSHGKVMY